MSVLTPFLVAGALLLFGLNVLVSFFPRKEKINVSFIPPSPLPSSFPDGVSGNEGPFRAINTKLKQLFSRLEELEWRVQGLERGSKAETKVAVSVPVRRKRKRSR